MGHFLPFHPPNSPKNQNSEKINISPGYIIILHMCTKNYDQMISSSWDMVRDGCNYFSFWDIFCPFTPLTAQKIKIKKKKKKKTPGDIIILHMCTKLIIRWCKVSEIWCVSNDIISHFGVLLPPQQPKKSEFWKSEKKPGDIITLHMCIKNYDQMMYKWSNLWCQQFPRGYPLFQFFDSNTFYWQSI